MNHYNEALEAKIGQLQRELAEAKSVLSDLMHEREADSFSQLVLANKGAVLKLVHRDTMMVCPMCRELQCKRVCIRYQLLTHDPSWLSQVVLQDHAHALEEDDRRYGRFEYYRPLSRLASQIEESASYGHPYPSTMYMNPRDFEVLSRDYRELMHSRDRLDAARYGLPLIAFASP